jgi:hypothetical protein
MRERLTLMLSCFRAEKERKKAELAREREMENRGGDGGVSSSAKPEVKARNAALHDLTVRISRNTLDENALNLA